MEWKKINGQPNSLLSRKGFYISYNPDPCGIIPLFASNNGSAETALSFNGEWRILNGDFRKEYEAAIDKGLDACLEVYEKYKASNRSSWSTDEL